MWWSPLGDPLGTCKCTPKIWKFVYISACWLDDDSLHLPSPESSGIYVNAPTLLFRVSLAVVPTLSLYF